MFVEGGVVFVEGGVVVMDRIVGADVGFCVDTDDDCVNEGSVDSLVCSVTDIHILE